MPKKEIALVSCTKSKLNTPSKPKDLYMKSDLFKKKRKYVENNYKEWYILSGKHFLLEPNGRKIRPYQSKIKGSGVKFKRNWSKVIFSELKRKGLLKHKIVIHAGQDYYKHLTPLLDKAGTEYEIPTARLGIGEKKAWYLKENKKKHNLIQKKFKIKGKCRTCNQYQKDLFLHLKKNPKHKTHRR